MATSVRMPEVLAGVTEAVLGHWMVTEGSVITVGDVLAELETEKAVVEYQSEIAGTIGRLLVEPGATVNVGSPIAVVLADGEQLDDLESSSAPAPAGADPESGAPVHEAPSLEAAAEPAPTPAPADTDPESGAPVHEAPSLEAAAESAAGRLAAETPRQPNLTTEGSRRLIATPVVRRIARDRGVDLASVPGTGPHGRVVRRDLERHLATVAPAPASPPSPEPAAVASRAAVDGPAPPAGRAAYKDTPLTGMRRAIARRLTESKSSVPHIYLKGECVVDPLLALRAEINSVASERVSVNDMIVKAVGAAFRRVPEANVILADDAVRQFEQVDVSVAIAIDNGLITPVLRDIGRLSVTEISRQMKDYSERATTGRIKQHEIEGGSFSVTNLGMYGTREFSAILNPPQSGILAVGAAVERPWVVGGQLAIAKVMTVTLSSDHRVVDGALAARWMSAFIAAVENPLATVIA
jgi:pyruvate dehydrogenase E2 component (dihydrolipoamide acetyltransferase)